MHDVVQEMIDKHKDKTQEAEEYLHSQASNDAPTIYSIEGIKHLADLEKIPRELADWYLIYYKESLKQHSEFQEFVKKTPDLSQEERCRKFFKQGPLSPEESAKMYENGALCTQILMHLMQNRELLSSIEPALLEKTSGLFKDIDLAEEFGIANCISNSLYHLEELLNNMNLIPLYENVYDAKGSVKNSKGESISLNYSFQASSLEEAEKILKEYKTIMINKGLKVWLAHWVMANKQGRVEYTSQMIDIMKLSSDEDRESFFSVKEKEEHWALTKMLNMSKLSRERKTKKRGTGNEVVQWVEQPLIEILGGEKEMTGEDKYPTLIAVRVLMPKIDKKGFSPNIYKNTTFLLNPSDLFLAFKLQTRANQLERGNRNIHADWDFIFEAGNLQATANTKKAVAKAQARKKMDRLQKNEIIEKWDEELMGVCVTPKKIKRGTKKDPKKEIT